MVARAVFLILSLCLAALTKTALAQAPTNQDSTAVGGRVVSTQGAPIARAEISFVGGDNHVTKAVSASDGAFTSALAPGAYRVNVSAVGFRPLTRGNLSVGSSPLVLKLELASASESLLEIARVGVNGGGLSTSSNVTVELNPQAYAQNGIERVSDILSEQIGLTAVRPMGGAATLPVVIALRGPDPSETLVDIDGHEVNNSNTGDFDLSLLDSADLSGIELLYGIAPSSLIGPNTIGGAINLRTLEPTSEPRGLIRASAGSYNTFVTTLQNTGTQGRLGYAFSFHRLTSQGELHDHTLLAPGSDPGTFDTASVSSDSSAMSALAKLRYALGGGSFAQLSFRNQSSIRDQSAALSTMNPDGTFSAFPGATVGVHNSAYGLDIYAPIGSRDSTGGSTSAVQFRHYSSVADQSVDGPIADNGSAYFFNSRDFVIEESLEYDRYFSHGSLTFKADVRTEALTEPFAALSSGGIIEQSRSPRPELVRPLDQSPPPISPVTESDVQRSFAIRYAFDALRNVQATLATYFSNFSSFGTALDPKLGLVWTPTKDSVVRASIGTTFQPPQLSQLFVPNPLPSPPTSGFVLIGNPKLQADRATEYQLGYERILGNGASATRAELDLYQTNLRTPIQLFVSNTGYAYPINIGGAVYRGFELRLERSFGAHVHASIGYSTNSTYATSVPTNIGGGSLVAGQQFMGVPLHRATFTIDGTFGRSYAFNVGAAYEGNNNELNRPAFATLQASVSANRGPYMFTLSGTNLTNVYADGFTRQDAGVPYPGPGGAPTLTPALALPANQITLSITRRY
jgi:outer membrane receptor protein involved in Fe transport